MQKKLIALAIAGLSGAAFAQSNVTVYGAMAVSWENIKADGDTTAANKIGSRSRLASNSSNIGFKGAESLGNGLTAVFQAEFGVGGDTGTFGSTTATGAPFATTGVSTRDTYVGVAGGFGTVAAGNLTHPVRAMGAKVDFNPGASSAGFTGTMYGEILGLKSGSDERASNAVAYITPTMNGFTGVVAYVNGENATDAAANANVSTKGKAVQLAVSYDNGPLYVGVAYDKHTDPLVGASVYGYALGASTTPSTNAGTGAVTQSGLYTGLTGLGVAAADATNFISGKAYNDSLKISRVAAKYSFPTGTSVSALWDKQKYEITNSIAGLNTDAERKAFMFGVNQAFGASNVWLQYARAKDLTGTVCGAITCGETGAKQVTLGYSYSLSKRTMIHALYSKVTNDQGATYDNYVGGAGLKADKNAGADTTTYGVGLRHSF